jgi:hypothetical protein
MAPTAIFGTDGYGTLTIDFETGEQRYSCKEDVAKMARVSDYLSSIAFYWPMVSAHDYGRLAPLHEPEQLEEAQQAELTRILQAAEHEIG